MFDGVRCGRALALAMAMFIGRRRRLSSLSCLRVGPLGRVAASITAKGELSAALVVGVLDLAGSLPALFEAAIALVERDAKIKTRMKPNLAVARAGPEFFPREFPGFFVKKCLSARKNGRA